MSKAGVVLIVLPTLAFALGIAAACAGSTAPDEAPPTTSSRLETFDASGEAYLAAALRELAARMPSVSESTTLRRRIADATFCLPQNIVGILYYAFLQLTGNILDVAVAAEGKIIVTKTPFGASLGRYIFVSEPLLCESALRHEYGHVLQGYKRGPFYLLSEGAASFAQATLSLAFPSFARGYFNRWPENEAERLGATAWPPSRR
ncbi:MAG: hypothetical protein PHU43_09370 [Candidatus Bipolaricaulis sp.]|nr:hypothetical protein [Candidatus Bipolaricaulis sp.]